MSIPAREAARKGLFGLHSPMVRWLQDMVASELDAIVASDESSETLLLRSLYNFCSEATELVRAFFLATLCREAVSIATRKREAKTYGKVSSAESGALVVFTALDYCTFVVPYHPCQYLQLNHGMICCENSEFVFSCHFV